MRDEVVIHIGDKKDEVNYNAFEEVYSRDWETYRDKDYFEYRDMWSSLPQSRTTTDFPIHLDIETTDLCNLHCPMCPRTVTGPKSKDGYEKYISKEHYIKVIDEAVENNVKSIKLQYLGEPTLHKDVVWQVKYAKEKGIIDVMLNSNATRLTDKLSRGLLEAGLDKIYFSFDAVSPELYAQQRVGATMGAVIDNIYAFVKLRNEISPKTFVRVQMVMYDDPIWKQQFEAMKVMWGDIVDALGYGLFTERDPTGFKEFEKVDGFACEQLFQRMFLKCNGNVTVCCIDNDDEYIVGNWKEESLKDIWHGKKYTEIRTEHINGNYNSINMCARCDIPVIFKQTYSA